MDSSGTALPDDASCTLATNWTVAGGSLDDSVTFETPLSLDDHDSDRSAEADRDQSTVGDPNPKSPIILYPPSPDSSSCEITLTFGQKQEVRQVYVRSTARVFEIYCESELGNGGEYLCTIRGCVAVRDEEVLRATNIEEAVLVHQMGSNKELAEGKFRNDASPTASEDGWVDVKALHTSLSFKKDGSNSDTDRGCSSQDLYEATAEISDTNPCKSLQIRLLSLQNKGCVCIHEVYVFAEPVDASTLEGEAVPGGNSSGSSLMAMLLPTFFQLSKTQGIGRERDEHNIGTIEQQISTESSLTTSDYIGARNISEEGPYDHSLGEHKSVKVNSSTPDPIVTQKKVQHEENDVPCLKARIPEAAHDPIPAWVSETETKRSSSENSVGSALDHLVSRVNRIEDLLLRFEERILKPVISIDERLQRVEQQLEVITKKTFKNGTRISAPEFSCSESETNSFYNSASLESSYMACEATKEDPTMVVSSTPTDVTTISENATQLQQSLVVNVPESDNDEDELNEPILKPLQFKKIRSVSIDDALASAFAGFLSSTSSHFQNYSPTLAVRAPDFPIEDENENDDDRASSTSIKSEITTDPQDSDEIAGPPMLYPGKPTGASDFTTSVSSGPCIGNVIGLLDAEEHLKAERAANRQCQNGEAYEGDANNVFRLAAEDNDLVGGPVSHLVLEDVPEEEANDDSTSNDAILEQAKMLEESSEDQTDGDFSDPQAADLHQLPDSTSVTEQDSDQDELKKVIQLSGTSSAVDYDNPILEVEFTTEERLDALQALLSGFGGLDVAAPSTQDNNISGPDCHGDLIPVNDWEAVNSSAMDSCIFIDQNYCSLEGANSNMKETDKKGDFESCSNLEGSVTSLI